jgi:hypothetical protein
MGAAILLYSRIRKWLLLVAFTLIHLKPSDLLFPVKIISSQGALSSLFFLDGSSHMI